MIKSEQMALTRLMEGPWEIWTEADENRVTIAVLQHLAERGLCKQERANSTLERFTITDGGKRRALSYTPPLHPRS